MKDWRAVVMRELQGRRRQRVWFALSFLVLCPVVLEGLDRALPRGGLTLGVLALLGVWLGFVQWDARR